MNILGIETSCDETAAAIVKDGREVLSNVVVSQIDIHAATGGVIPEVAARSHIEAINAVVNQAVEPVGWADIDAIAVTTHPGLIGSLMVGSLAARTLAITHDRTLYAIDHILAHIYAAQLGQQDDYEFPLLALVVSGGHTSLILMHSHKNYEVLGQTRDDAVGEAFDKVAKILGLPYPGGPSVAEAARAGQSTISLPIAKLENPYDFSFSGLKTAVLRAAQKLAGVGLDTPSADLAAKLTEQQKTDLAASFQATAIETLAQKLHKAAEKYHPKQIIVAGGVASSEALRAAVHQTFPNATFPAPEFSTDNAAMVAARAYYESEFTKPADPYDVTLTPN